MEETVRLREEPVDVQRRAVGRRATEADFAAFKEGSVGVREMSEEAVASKPARVVGEVNIGKTVTERDAAVQGTCIPFHLISDVFQTAHTSSAGSGVGSRFRAAKLVLRPHCRNARAQRLQADCCTLSEASR